MIKMNDVTISRENLPVTIDRLQEFILIGKEQLKAHKAKIRAIEKLNMAIAAKQAALEDAQVVADILLDAEVKLGEMLEGIDRKYVGSIKGTNVPKQEKTLPPNIDKKQSHYAQQIAKTYARQASTIYLGGLDGFLSYFLRRSLMASKNRSVRVLLWSRARYFSLFII